MAGAVVATTALGLPQQASSVGSDGAPALLDASAPVDRAELKPRRDACGKARVKGNGRRWRCSFVDNFAKRAIDESKWLVVDTSWSAFRIGSSCLFSKNVKVRRGALRVKARDEGSPFLCRSSRGSFNTRYSGGHLTTHQRFAQAYGMFEVRARYPKRVGQGVRGAFWLYPEEEAYGRWPRSGEVDVAEWWSHEPTTVAPSLHYPGRNRQVDTGRRCKVKDVSKFHVYTVVWSSQRMVFKIDGRACFKRAWAPAWPMVRPQPFDQPFALVLSFAVDRLDGRNPPTSRTRLPATMAVDYAKVWR